MAISNMRWSLVSIIALMYIMSAVSGSRLHVSNETTTETEGIVEDLKEKNSQQNNWQSVIDFVSPKDAKIVGGRDAVYGKYPWQARLHIKEIIDKIVKYSICGASILNNYWLISAAHCFEHAVKVWVIVGDYHIQSRDAREEHFTAEKFIMHKNYENQEIGYDIALIKIEPKHGRGMIFSKYVQAISLPTSTTPYTVGTKCKISGWGYTSFVNQTFPLILQAAEVPIISQRVCAKIYKSPAVHTNQGFCAGYTRGGIDACSGDSGGPLVCNVKGVNQLLGITSFGVGCAKPNYLGVYTRVSKFLSWIKSTMRKKFTSKVGEGPRVWRETLVKL